MQCVSPQQLEKVSQCALIEGTSWNLRSCLLNFLACIFSVYCSPKIPGLLFRIFNKIIRSTLQGMRATTILNAAAGQLVPIFTHIMVYTFDGMKVNIRTHTWTKRHTHFTQATGQLKRLILCVAPGLSHVSGVLMLMLRMPQAAYNGPIERLHEV